jgi:hypothetical protein
MQEDELETQLNNTKKRYTAKNLQDVNDVCVSAVSTSNQYPLDAHASGVFSTRAIPCGFASTSRHFDGKREQRVL